MCLNLPAWWGQLLLHNRESFPPHFVHIFCLWVGGYVCHSHFPPPEFCPHNLVFAIYVVHDEGVLGFCVDINPWIPPHILA